jgi:HPt (histidine-containing phosphotransfer) domain-containing protein
VKDNRTKYEEVKIAVETGDITLAHRLAHSLKSNAGLIGRPKLQKIAADIEASLKSGENPVTEEQMNSLHFELQTALDEMASYNEKTDKAKTEAERHGTETATEYDAEKARLLIEKLEPLLRSGNPECLDLIDGLRRIPGSEELIQQMEDFYFSAAFELFMELKERMENDQWKIK